MLTTFLYLEVNLIGLIIAAIMLGNQHKAAGLSADQKVFNMIIIALMFVLVFDSGMWLLDGRQFLYAIELNYFVSTVYYLLNIIIPFMWIWYTMVCFDKDAEFFGKYRLPALAPLVVGIVIVFLNLANDWVFSIDENNVYTRNAGMAVVIALALAYLIGSAVVALVQAKKAETRSERKKCITLVSFLILPVVGVGIQSEVYGVSLIWICATLSCLMIFVTIQNRQITTDALTALNNRYQFDKYLARIVNNDDGQQYSLIMIDIDKFKEVNDTYGHLRGDKLLASVSDVLKKSCARTNSFLSRYGGDEFAIVCEAQHAQQLKQLIENNIWKFNQKHVKDVLVSLSIGYSSLMEGDAVDDLIARADAEMYKEKANRT